MKVTLDKQIQLHSVIVYLRFEKDISRKDIQEYLNGKHFTNRLIEDRVRDYLRNIRIYDEKFQLTALGNKVKETGLLATREEGKYHIWFTRKDSYWGNKIFYFKRVQPLRESSDEMLELKLDEDIHFYLPTENNVFSYLKLLPIKEYFGEIRNHTNTISMRWVWENLEKSHYVFNGQIENKDKPISIKSEAILCDKEIQKIISEILVDWNNKQKRYSIRFDGLSEQMRSTFEDKNYTSKWNDFEVQILNLPLMPYDNEEAKKWRNWLLNEELKKEYFSIIDFEDKASELNEKEALETFGLDIPKVKDFVEKTDSKKVFWHLTAPIDLNPNTKIKLPPKQQHIEFKQGDSVSFENIVKKLGFDNSSVFVYYDRYVYTYNQQRAVSALVKAVNSTKKIVVTDLTPKDNSSDFIQKNIKEITLRDCKTIFKGRSPHDRYLVASGQTGMSIWNISNSIDYISFSDRNINETTVGKIRQSVVFTPISKEMLDIDLLNFINDETKNGN